MNTVVLMSSTNARPLALSEAVVERAALLLKMKLNSIALLAFIGYAGLAAGQTITDPAHIEVYITPYYNSKGPAIDVGPFSSGLAAKNET